MHSAFRKPNYPKAEKRRKNNPATVVFAQPPQIKMWSTQNSMLYPDNSGLVPILHRIEPHQKCITMKYFLIFMKAPPISMGGWVGRAGCVESVLHSHVLSLRQCHRDWNGLEHTLHIPFLLETRCCHGNNSVVSAIPWHPLTEWCL